MKVALSVAARLLFAAFCFLSAAFCVLAIIPFTYVQVIKLNLLPGQQAFVAWHRFAYWLAAAAGAFSVAEDLRDPRLRRGGLVVLGAMAAVGVLLAVYPVLSHLRNERWMLIWAAMFLALPVLLVVLDVRAQRGRLIWADRTAVDDGRVFGAAWSSALFVWGTYSAAFAVRFVLGFRGEKVLPADQMLMAALVSLTLHVLLFMGVFAVMSLVRAVAFTMAPRARAEFWLFFAVSAVPISIVIKGLILGAVSFGGGEAVAIAVAFSVTALAVLAGLALRLPRDPAAPVESGLELALRPIALCRQPSRLRRRLTGAALSLGGVVAVVLASRMDWNYLVQTLAVLPVWVLAFAMLYVSSPPQKTRTPTGLYLGAAALSVFLYQGMERTRVWLQPRLLTAGLDLGQVIDRYAGREVSYRALREALHASPDRQEDAQFYGLLQKNSNLARQIDVRPIEVTFAPGLKLSAGAKPNVFVLVIDSLRRDYVSAYNPQVSFTPALDAFARDSVVFRHAFTPYGGTGLSEPAIWMGGRMPHKLYLTPFRPMNALQTLVQTEGYRAWVSMDLLLSTAVTPWPDFEELDRNIANKDYDLCRTLGEVQGRLDRQPSDTPIFVYTQSQNIHVSNIAREGSRAIDGQAYPGFHPPYASRVRRIDGCFGEFINQLKRRGLYDSSIIIVTADHGDSLGEGGRWGHAYTVFPEILRVPLIVHVPPALLASRRIDPELTAFQMDLTPTLYDLLGHPPTLPNDIFGRSLLPRSDSPVAPERPWHLVSSSYGPVWGVLGPRGRWLYIADGVNFRDYYFDLDKDPAGERNLVDAQIRADNTQRIRQGLSRIHETWKLPVFE